MSNIQHLISILISGGDAQAETAALEISTFGDEALPYLRELLASLNPDHRWWATRTLALIADSQASNLLLESLGDSDLAVRQCAALALKEQPVPKAIPALIKTLDNEDQLLSRLAAEALITVGEPAVPKLIEILESGSQRAQGEAARALAQIGDKRAIPVMFEVWENGSALVKHWIEDAFQKMGVGMTFFSPE